MKILAALLLVTGVAQAGVTLKENRVDCGAPPAPMNNEQQPRAANGAVLAPNGMPLPPHLHAPVRRCTPRAPYYYNGVLIVNDFYCNG